MKFFIYLILFILPFQGQSQRNETIIKFFDETLLLNPKNYDSNLRYRLQLFTQNYPKYLKYGEAKCEAIIKRFFLDYNTDQKISYDFMLKNRYNLNPEIINAFKEKYLLNLHEEDPYYHSLISNYQLVQYKEAIESKMNKNIFKKFIDKNGKPNFRFGPYTVDELTPINTLINLGEEEYQDSINWLIRFLYDDISKVELQLNKLTRLFMVVGHTVGSIDNPRIVFDNVYLCKDTGFGDEINDEIRNDFLTFILVNKLDPVSKERVWNILEEPNVSKIDSLFEYLFKGELPENLKWKQSQTN